MTVNDNAQALVLDALDHQQGAMTRLVARLTPVIRVRARRFISRLSHARRARFELEDLVQDVWFDVLKDDGRALRSFDPRRNPSLEYFTVLLADRRLSHIYDSEFKTEKRRADREAEATDDLDRLRSPGDTPAAQVEQAQLAAGLTEFLDEQLPPKGRLICRMLYADGASADQISVALGVRKQVVYNWQHRIRVLAQEFLG